MRQSALLHHHAYHLRPFGKALAHGALGGYGTKGSGRAHGSPARGQGVWRSFRGDSVLHRAENRLYRTAHILYPCTGSGFSCHCVQASRKAACRGVRRRLVLPRG